MNWLKAHWRKLAGIAVGVVGAFLPPGFREVLLAVGGSVLGSDFQVGSSAGTPLGQAAKDAQAVLDDAKAQAAKAKIEAGLAAAVPKK